MNSTLSTFAHESQCPEACGPPVQGQRRLRVWVLAALLAVCFYTVEHSWYASSLWQEGAAREADKIDLDEIVAHGSRTRQIAFAILGLCGGVLLLCNRPNTLRITFPAALFIGYFGIQLASVMWSIDPLLSAKRGAVLLFLGVAAVGVHRALTAQELRQTVLVTCALFLMVGVIAELQLGVFRPTSFGYRFAGTVHPNTQAIHCVLLALAAALFPCQSFRQRCWVWLVVGVAVVLLLLTKSRTSLLGLVVVGALVIWLRTSARTRLVLAIGVLFATSSCLLLLEMSGYSLGERLHEVLLLGRTGKTATLSGRIPLWSELVPYLIDRPILGYGYGAFWSPDRILEMAAKTKWQMVHSHSAYIETLLAVGLVGLLTMLALVCVCLTRHLRIYRTTEDTGNAFSVAVLVFFLIYSCLEAGFLLPTFASMVWMTSMAAAAFTRRECEEKSAALVAPQWTPNEILSVRDPAL